MEHRIKSGPGIAGCGTDQTGIRNHVRSKSYKRFTFILFLYLPQFVLSQNPDIRILRSINSSQTLPSDKFFQFISNSDTYVALGIPAGIAFAGLLKHDNNVLRNACVIAATLAVNEGVTEIMKYSINRTRPFVTYPEITKKSGAGSPSFPSGHTSIAFAAATSLSLELPKWYVIIPVYTWAGTVAYSRMDLGVHYPSDVIAGALVGAGSAWLCYGVNKKLNLYLTKKH